MPDIEQQKNWQRGLNAKKTGKTLPTAKAMKLDPQQNSAISNPQQAKRDLNQARTRNLNSIGNKANLNPLPNVSASNNASSPIDGSNENTGRSTPQALLKKTAVPPQMKVASAITNRLEPMIGKKMANVLKILLASCLTFGCCSSGCILALLPYIFFVFLIGKAFGAF